MRAGGATIRQGTAWAIAAAAGLAAAWAAAILLAGGFRGHLGSVAFVARDPLRPAVAAVVLLTILRVVAGDAAFRGMARRIAGSAGTAARRFAIGLSLAVLLTALAWNTRAAGGSDSSCYLLQAGAFAQGRAALTVQPGDVAGLPAAAFAPGGFIASGRPPFDPVPICGAGLALFMAPFVAIAPDLGFAVVPLFAAVAVWLTFVFGRQIAGPACGAWGAALTASSPIFLYQAVQPMSDVPAAALWLGALAALGRGDAKGNVSAGICASLAVLTRPNMAVAVLPLLVMLRSPRAWVQFCAAAVPGLGVMALLNLLRYGSAFASGYGDPNALFSVGHILPNLRRYPLWLVETQTPLIALAVLAPFVVPASRRRVCLAGLAGAALIAGLYLAYTVFEEWWYLRFLLPALPVLLCATAATVLGTTRGRPMLRMAVSVGLACLVAWSVHVAISRHVFDLQALESRFRVAGAYAGRVAPADAVIISAHESGALVFHGRRSILMWDQLPPGEFDRTVTRLEDAGFPVFVAVEETEEEALRHRFQGQRFGALDWPPVGEIIRPVRVRVYRIADRARFKAGDRLDVEYVR